MSIEAIPKEDLDQSEAPVVEEPWNVILYNDDVHTFDEVIVQLQKATGCSMADAERITYEAHLNGKAVAFSGSFDDCLAVAGILREIQLIVEIRG